MNLLDFSTPNVGYEDREKRAVCGCCGTYYVVGVDELTEAKEIVSDLYEALRAIVKDVDQTGYCRVQNIVKAQEALAEVGKK